MWIGGGTFALLVSFSLLKICQIGSQAQTVGLQISKTFQNL
jgi:hypothetical protein